jgi:Ni,Fe-hydrogenase I small subunit
MAATLEAKPSGVEEVHILWISEGTSCDGDSVSITAAGQPGIEDVLLGTKRSIRDECRSTTPLRTAATIV